MSIACQISLIKIAASLFDIRGLQFIKDLNNTEIGFRIVFYRRVPDNFYDWLCGRGVITDEVEYDDDGNTQYMYMFLK